MPTYITLEDVLRKKGIGPLNALMVSIFRESKLLNMLTFKNIDGAHDEFSRETQLPTPQHRLIHGTYTATRGTNSLGTEGLRIFGLKISLDRFMKRVGQFDIAKEVSSASRAIRLLLEYEMIYGNPLDDTDPGQITGLQFYSSNSLGNEADTSISAGSTAGGAALSLKLVQNAIDNCWPRPTHIITGGKVGNILTAGSRDADVSGFIVRNDASFGGRVTTFDGLPIIKMDRDHLNAKILDMNEAAISGSATAGSLYIVSHTPQDGGWYPFMNGGPFVEEDANTAAPMKERELEWYVATNRPQPTAVVRIKHIGDLAMVP